MDFRHGAEAAAPPQSHLSAHPVGVSCPSFEDDPQARSGLMVSKQQQGAFTLSSGHVPATVVVVVREGQASSLTRNPQPALIG